MRRRLDIFRLLQLAALCGSVVPILFFGHLLTVVIWVIALIIVAVPKWSIARVAVPVWVFLGVSFFLPYDLSFENRPGPPHFARLLMGIPSKEGMAELRAGQAVLGGCATSGFEPKYVWVW